MAVIARSSRIDRAVRIVGKVRGSAIENADASSTASMRRPYLDTIWPNDRDADRLT